MMLDDLALALSRPEIIERISVMLKSPNSDVHRTGLDTVFSLSQHGEI
jgi:hypothetical protein